MPKLSGQSIICDASALISLTDSCFLSALYFLGKKYRGKFIIPPSVEYECVDHPMGMKMHAMHALRLRRAINEGALEVVEPPEPQMADQLKFLANSAFRSGGTPLRLLHQGESEMLSLALSLGVENLLIDERTTRLLCEDAELLRQHLEIELRRPVTADSASLSEFERRTNHLRFFRSSEILLLAYEKGYFDDYGKLAPDAIEAALYRLKYSGCAIGMGEIGEYIASNI